MSSSRWFSFSILYRTVTLLWIPEGSFSHSLHNLHDLTPPQDIQDQKVAYSHAGFRKAKAMTTCSMRPWLTFTLLRSLTLESSKSRQSVKSTEHAAKGLLCIRPRLEFCKTIGLFEKLGRVSKKFHNFANLNKSTGSCWSELESCKEECVTTAWWIKFRQRLAR